MKCNMRVSFVICCGSSETDSQSQIDRSALSLTYVTSCRPSLLLDITQSQSSFFTSWETSALIARRHAEVFREDVSFEEYMMQWSARRRVLSAGRVKMKVAPCGRI